MEIVKRFMFWIVLGLILILAAGSYYYTVPALDEDTKAVLDQCKLKQDQATELAKAPDTIMNARYVNAANAFHEQLKDQQTQLMKSWDGCGLKFEDTLKAAPADLVTFEGWYKTRCAELSEKAAKAGLNLPLDFAKNLLSEGSNAKSESERVERVKRLVLVQEVAQAFINAKATVTRYRFTPRRSESETEQQVSVGVCSLDSMRLLDSKEIGELNHQAQLDVALAAKQKIGGGAEKAVLEPYAISGLELIFTAPLPVVPAALRNLESSQNYYGVIRRIDTQRSSDLYPQPQETVPAFARPSGGGAADEVAVSAALQNTHYAEGPVKVLVVLELLTFDQAAAEKIVAPPATSKPTTGKPAAGGKSK